MFLALATIGIAGCNGFKKGDSGLLYKIVEDKSGPSIKAGDFVSLNVIIKNDADSVMMSSYEAGHREQLIEKVQQKGDIFSALTELSEGDSAIIKMNLDTMFKGRTKPPSVKGKYITYIIKIEKVIAKGNLSDEVFKGRYDEYMKTQADATKKLEPGKIKKYIADKNLKVTETASGLKYVVTKEGSGPKPGIGDTVVVNYVARYITGKAFEASDKATAIKEKLQINPGGQYKPLRFPIGGTGMIRGLAEGLSMLNKGAKATFILPSSIAYGEQGNGLIQPFSPLVFDIESLDIIHPNPNAPKPVAPVMPQQQQQQPVKK